MKRLIILSWVSILAGSGILFLAIAGIWPAYGTALSYALGNSLLTLPNVIWVLISNKIASTSLNKPPSLVISGLAITVFLATFLSFGLLSPVLDALFRPNDFVYTPAIDLIITIALLTMFVSLITSKIMVSRLIVDAQDSPHAGRASRIFVLCIGFFYIAIGMFFIASVLKKLKNNKD